MLKSLLKSFILGFVYGLAVSSLALAFSCLVYDLAYAQCGGSGVNFSPATVTPISAGAHCDDKMISDATASGSSPNVIITSPAQAQFTPADVGKLACLAAASTSTTNVQVGNPTVTANNEACGTITAYISATQVKVSFAAANLPSNVEFDYGTDDTAVLNTMFQNLANTGGGEVAWGPYSCATSGTVIVPFAGTLGPDTINVVGAGSTIPRWAFNATIFDRAPTSQLHLLNNSFTGPAVTLDSSGVVGACQAANMTHDSWQMVSIRAGAGVDQHGSTGTGAYGILLNDNQQVRLQDFYVSNFGGDNIHVTVGPGFGSTDCQNELKLSGVYSFASGQFGLNVTQNGGSGFIQQIDVSDSEFENNALEGVQIYGTIHGITFRNNVFQRDDTSQTQGLYEVDFGHAVIDGSCMFSGGDYVENDGNNAIITGVNDPNGQCFQDNIVQAGNSSGNGWVFPYQPPSVGYSSPAPAAEGGIQFVPSGLAHWGTCTLSAEGALETQSDSTHSSCTAGTTAAGAGSHHCQILCHCPTGLLASCAWVETGL